jgi:hypothetical protein
MEKYDHLEIRCPRLGGAVTFAYCRQEGGAMPCFRIITCWHPFFPVEQHMKENMTADSWDNFVCHMPKGKITTLIELIEEAKKRTQQKNE